MALKNKSTTTSVSFKSSGQNIDEVDSAASAVRASNFESPIWIKTPLELGSADLFATHKNMADTIADNLRNLVLTNKGERIGNPAFGTNLRRTQFNVANKEEAEQKMMQDIQAAVSRFMPFVNLQEFTTSQLPSSMVRGSDPTAGYPGGVLLIRISYTIPSFSTAVR